MATTDIISTCYEWNWGDASSSSYYYKDEPIETDQSIWSEWLKPLSDLKYLYRKYSQIIVRKIHRVTRRSDPRWRAGRWRAKT